MAPRAVEALPAESLSGWDKLYSTQASMDSPGDVKVLLAPRFEASRHLGDMEPAPICVADESHPPCIIYVLFSSSIPSTQTSSSNPHVAGPYASRQVTWPS